MNEPKASRYQRLRRRAHVGGLVSAVAVLALVAVSGGARQLGDAASAASSVLPQSLQAAAAVLLCAAVLALLAEASSAGVVLWTGLAIERQFDGRLGTAAGLLRSHVRSGLLRLAAALAAACVFVASVQAGGGWWWLIAGAVAALAWGAALRLFPVVVVRPSDTRPIARRSLMSALREIARRSDVPISDIVEWRAAAGRGGALIAGFGRTCRVLVASEILREWSDDEIAVVVAHELAHHVHRDLWRELVVNAALLSVALWTAGQALAVSAGALRAGGPADPAALPLVALVAGGVWLATTPIRFAQSRRHERRADRFALRLTREADAFAAAVRRLSARHLSDEAPSFWVRGFFYRHPPVAERLAMAERFRSEAEDANCASDRPRASLPSPYSDRRPSTYI